MNKNFVSFGIIFCLALFSLPASADDHDRVSTISSSATANLEAEPDTVSFSAAIITENKNLNTAIEENNKKSNKVYEAIKSLLGPDDKIKTSNFRVSPKYTYTKNTGKREIDGYEVTNQIIVTTKKLESISKLLQTSTQNGANRINRLSFTIENKDKFCNELLEKAVVKAKSKAEAIAKALGVKITGVNKVSSNCYSQQVGPVRYDFEAAGMLSSKAPSIPVEAGEVDLNANVTVEFIIQD